MVTKKTTAGKKVTAKIKLKKETLRDLDVKSKAAGVKGGAVGSVTCLPTRPVCRGV